MSPAIRSSSHKKRHGHHQKRTPQFLKTYHPFMPLLLMVTGSLLVFSVLSGKPSSPSPQTSQAGSEPVVLAYATSISNDGLLNATNSRRSAASKGALTINTKLSQAAQAKANDMATRNYWAHNTPDGTPPWSFITNAGYSYDKAGENLACGFDESSDVVTGWYNSPSHRDNLLHPDYTEVGFGIANAASYNCGDLGATQQTIVVAMYAKPYTAPTTNSATPTATTSQTKPATASAPATSTQQSTSPTTTHTVTINVVDSKGKPSVNTKTTLHSEPQTGYTDKNGNVVFKNVSSGSHTIILEIDGAKSETPLDLTNMSKDYKITIVKPELVSNQTSRSSEESTIAKPQAINRLQTLTDNYAAWITAFLVFAVLLGIGYLIVKHSVAAHRALVKGERYVLTHKYIDALIILLALALYFLTRSVANVL